METDVNITRHKKKLDSIRERYPDGKDREDDRRCSEVASGSIQTAQGTSEGDARPIQGTSYSDGSGEKRMESWEGAARGNGQGVRSVDTENQLAVESTYPNYGEVGTGKLTIDETPEQKAERERELARQRKQRQRDREKSEKAQDTGAFSSSIRDRDSDIAVTQNIAEGSRFQLKNPFSLNKEPEKVKLFSKSEADEAHEAITKVLMVGSSLLDDILEIIVKDHEAVQIWEMDEDEATLFAQAHLKRAQKDQDAARVARKLIQIHDKLLTFQYLFSRSKATVTHVKNHGGFGFR